MELFKNPKKIIIALDDISDFEILDLVDELKDYCIFKLNASFVKHGPELIKKINDRGGEVFLDMKFHDIPNTIRNHAICACMNNVFMFNVHCLGGVEMMNQARNAVDSFEGNPPLLIGVTILTSIDEETMKRLGINMSVEEQVKNLALMAKEAGLDGVVCSPHETKIIKEVCGKDFLIITPGIRPKWSSIDDQKRITTPKQAIENGSDFLVIGRPIIKAQNYNMSRVEAVKKVLEEIE